MVMWDLTARPLRLSNVEGGADDWSSGSTSSTSSVQQRIVIVTAVQTLVLRGHVWTVGFVTEQSSGVATYLRMLWLFKAGLIARWEKQGETPTGVGADNKSAAHCGFFHRLRTRWKSS